ncbi:MAG: M20 aminoacylase family protein [Burkholderiaceae bacterium]
MKLIDDITAFQNDLRQIRRDLHSHPELRYEEHRTADAVAGRLQEFGLDVSRGLAGTGVVGTLRGSLSDRSVGLRADLDALPLQEHNEFGHRSTHDGVMHACGHDGHTAMLLGAARYMAAHCDFAGTVHFIFQPAEEGGAGGKRMVDEGLFEQHPCEAVFGMHNWPGMKVGQFAVCTGSMMASSNEFEITINGRGAHAAMPHNGADPVLVACQVVQGLQSIINRNKKPIDSAVLSVTQIYGGDAYNVIPDKAVIRGTVRTFSVEVLDLIETRMRDITETLPTAFGATGELSFVRNYPPLINHPNETKFCQQVMTNMVGQDNVLNFEPTMGSEDFAFMLLEKPGCYVMIGNGDGEHREIGHGEGPCTLHNPNYDFNDELLPIGATYWVNLARAWLDRSE